MTEKLILILILCLAFVSADVYAQDSKLLKRVITKTDRFDFGAGGTLAITGAPVGSIKVIGTPTNEIEITAEIEIQAATEADLDLLAIVTSFVTDETVSRTRIISSGTHNKLGDKKMWKKFPKKLMGLPFRIDYVVHVPQYCDLEIDGGKGDLVVTGVNGAMAINFLESNAHIEVIGGAMTATIGTGTVFVDLGVKGWAGRPASVQLATGDLTVRLPSNTSAEIDAVILKTGAIENMLPDLKQRDRKVAFTDKLIMAKAGVGGPSIKFKVGDGNLRLERLVAGQ